MLEALYGLRRIVVELIEMVTTSEWSLNEFEPMIHKFVALFSEINLLKPLVEDFLGLSITFGECQEIWKVQGIILIATKSCQFYHFVQGRKI